MGSSTAIFAGFGVLAESVTQPCLAFPFTSNITVSQTTPDYDNVHFKRAEAQDFYLHHPSSRRVHHGRGARTR